MPAHDLRSTAPRRSTYYNGATSTRIVKLGIALVFHAYNIVRSLVRRIAGRPAGSSFIVLMYHSVKRSEREQFARQMDQLRRVAHTVYADFEHRDTVNRRYVAVTFDDGYGSVLDNAVPILNERSIPATLFVPTQHLGRAPGWITDEGHRDAAERVLSSREVREMSDAGVLIGSHSVTHRRMTEISLADAAAELSESRRALSQTLGRDVRTFALPYGAGNADVLREAAAAGYTRVFLNVPAHNGAAAHVVGRIEVSPTDWRAEYYLKIRGAYEWLPVALAAKRRVLNTLRSLSDTGVRREPKRHTVSHLPRSIVSRSSNRAIRAFWYLAVGLVLA